MEISGGLFVLPLILPARPRPVQQQRENAVQKSGRRIDRGDVLIERKIARPELDRLIGRGEQQVGQSVQRALRLRPARRRNAVERIVQARRLVHIRQPFEQLRHGLQLIGRPWLARRTPWRCGIRAAPGAPPRCCSATGSSGTGARSHPGPRDSPPAPCAPGRQIRGAALARSSSLK